MVLTWAGVMPPALGSVSRLPIALAHGKWPGSSFIGTCSEDLEMLAIINMKNILIVDRDPVMLQTFAGLLKSQGQLLHVTTADSGKTALNILARFKIDLLVTGLKIPDLDGFQLLSHVSHNYPELRTIVMVEGPIGIAQARLQRVGSRAVATPTTDIGHLIQRVFTELQIDYGGHMRGISLPSFLQMLELEGKSCRLNISTTDKSGVLFIMEGELIDGQTGKSEGETAVFDILSWQTSQFDIDYAPFQRVRRIHKPLMSILLESRDRLDKGLGAVDNQRGQDRVECLFTVEYNFEDWTYLSFVRDISLGGLYLETEEPVSVGQSILLTLSAQNGRSCDISGEVVRRDERGIGVRFDELSMHQRTILQDLMHSC
jgi:CheY-like chemotaxis protein/Tfp pilus assembly protein PilZ